MKTCKTCNQLKPLSDFPSNGQRLRTQCRPCYNKTQLEQRAARPEEIKALWRKASNKYYSTDRRRTKTLKDYNITTEIYNQMVDSQDGKCAICGKVQKLVVDHDHGKGNVRGLLCNSCNVGLGHFKDSIDILQKAVVYLNLQAGGR